MKCSLGYLYFSWGGLVFPILLFSSISLHWSLRKLSYLFLLFFGTLHSDVYIFPFLLCFLLLFFSQLFVRPPQTVVCFFYFFHFFSMGIVLIPVSCTMSWTSVHSSSGTLSIRSSPLNLLGHTASKFGKLSSCHRTEKGQFSFQSQRETTPKNAQTTAQLHSSHRLVK